MPREMHGVCLTCDNYSTIRNFSHYAELFAGLSYQAME